MSGDDIQALFDLQHQLSEKVASMHGDIREMKATMTERCMAHGERIRTNEKAVSELKTAQIRVTTIIGAAAAMAGAGLTYLFRKVFG